MSAKTQAKVLRVLQEGEVERLGSARTIKVDVRVIAATNKDLEEEITKGQFREDLHFRLAVIPIYVPLRERPDDIRCWCVTSSNTSAATTTPGRSGLPRGRST
jgi:transcriptional regulator with GAF, ATPase, and Fis domain